MELNSFVQAQRHETRGPLEVSERLIYLGAFKGLQYSTICIPLHALFKPHCPIMSISTINDAAPATAVAPPSTFPFELRKA